MKTCAKYISVVINSKFHVLDDKVREEPTFILVCDDSVKDKDEVLCRKGLRRKHLY